MKKIWDLYLKAPWDKKILLSAFGLSFFPIFMGVLWHAQNPAETQNQKAERPQVDTYIPKGFVLVPIEIQNYESLDSILGQFGVVDLFQSGDPSRMRQRIVAKNVRILRAPQNPSHFAVLIQENEVSSILKDSTPFFVVVKHPEKSGTEFVKGETKPRRAIVYERE